MREGKPGERHPPKLPKPLAAAQTTEIEEHELYSQLLFDHLDFSGTHAARPAFEQVLFRRSIFLQTHLPDLRLLDCRLEKCDTSAAMWEKAHLRRVEFNGCRMLGAVLIEAALEDILFTECLAEKINFGFAVLKITRFEQCNLRSASFAGADCRGVVFHGCDLSGADFREAKLESADLRTATINGLQVGVKELQGAIIAPEQAVQVAGLLGIRVQEPDDML